MKEEIVIRMKEELKSGETIKKDSSRIKRIKELEKNEIVKEYLKLLSIYGAMPKEISYNDENAIDSTIDDALSLIDKDSTNGIYVYLGTFEYIDLSEFADGVDEVVKRNDKNAYKRKYFNIEREEVTEVPIALCNKFEKENRILYLGDSWDYYFSDAIDDAKRIQREFFKSVIDYDQEKAVKTILKKYNRKKGEY